jgi:hypothetical protein
MADIYLLLLPNYGAFRAYDFNVVRIEDSISSILGMACNR